MKTPGHFEYAIQCCMDDIEGQPRWWIATNWFNSPADANDDYERFIIRNKNEGVNEKFAARMIRRVVCDYEALSAKETALLLAPTPWTWKGGNYADA